MGQSTATSPKGRNRFNGEPMKMAELIASLDGPVYVERVALFSPADRKKAARAIKKAVQIQKEGRGYSFIEVLAECPTHLKMAPDKAEKWVKECMVPIFPLGVKKDTTVEPWFKLPTPNFEAKPFIKAVGATTEAQERFCKGFPTHLNPIDVSMKLAGSGGDGAQTAAMLVATAAINEGFDGTHIPSYGPESRGGTSYADVHVAKDEVLNPASPTPDILIAFNAPSLAKFGLTVKKNGFIIYDSSVAKDVKPARSQHHRGGRALHRDRRGPGQVRGEEHRGPGRPPGRHEPLPEGDLHHRHQGSPEGEGRPDPPQRAGLPGRHGRRQGLPGRQEEVARIQAKGKARQLPGLSLCLDASCPYFTAAFRASIRSVLSQLKPSRPKWP